MVASSPFLRVTPTPLDLSSTIPFTNLFVVIMLLAGAVVALVAGLLGYIVLRYRDRPGEAPPPQVFGNRRLEITWTALPAVVVAVIFVYMFVDMRRGPTPGTGLPDGQQPDIVVVGHQWWWEVRYPKHGNVVTANEVHLPVGTTILVQLESADVQHDFWVPELGQKMDLYPNKTNYLWLEAKEPGTYLGVCAEYCGTQHAWMRIRAIAQPAADFGAWVEAQRSSTQPAANDPAVRGQSLFTQYACGSCHAIAGTQYNGRAAPALTNYSDRQTISAGVLDHTPENLARYLRNPQAVKPGSSMPNFRLTEPEVQSLVAYLESLR